MNERRKTSRAILFIENKIVLIRRKKYNNSELIKEYYVIPGGHIDGEETFEDAVIREVKEELGIEVKIKELVLSEYNKDLDQDEKFFECEYIKGKIGTGTGEEWTNPNIEKYGSYEIVFKTIEEIENINLLPKSIKKIIIEKYKI